MLPAASAKRGKTCYRRQALSAGKYVTDSKRAKTCTSRLLCTWLAESVTRVFFNPANAAKTKVRQQQTSSPVVTACRSTSLDSITRIRDRDIGRQRLTFIWSTFRFTSLRAWFNCQREGRKLVKLVLSFFTWFCTSLEEKTTISFWLVNKILWTETLSKCKTKANPQFLSRHRRTAQQGNLKKAGLPWCV